MDVILFGKMSFDFFLKTGNPRYAHEATDILAVYENDHSR